MKNDLWNNFLHTGSVQDYLKYKQNEGVGAVISPTNVITNANDNQGLDNKGTDYRGE